MQAIIQEFEGKADAITAKVKAGEISTPQAIASLFGELFSAVAQAAAEGVAADLASLQSVGAEKFEISPPGVTFAKEFVMPPLGADGLIGRTYMLKVKKQRSADVADSALYLFKTGSTEADLRSFRPDLIIKKAANRQAFHCGTVAGSALWLWLNVGTREDSLRSADKWDINEMCRYFVKKFDRERVEVADAAEWLFQRVDFYTDKTLRCARPIGEVLEGMTCKTIGKAFASSLAAYDEARTKIADAAQWIAANDTRRPLANTLEWLTQARPSDVMAHRNLVETNQKEAAADAKKARRRIVASQAWWLFDVEEWTQDELADASVETIKAAQSRCFLQYQAQRLKTADYAEFLHRFGIVTEATLRARTGDAIRMAGENTLARFTEARHKSADKAWTLFDDGFTPYGIERLIALDFL